MLLACGDNAFPMVPHDVALDLIAALGFEGFDLMLMDNSSHVQPREVLVDIENWAGRLEERVRSRGLAFADVMCLPASDFGTMAANSPDEKDRERGTSLFRGVLDLAARLESPGLTMPPGIDWPHETHEESLRRAGQELANRVQEANERGVRFSIEPHIGSVCQSPSDVLLLCELAPGLELTLDYTHFIIQGFEEGDIEPLISHARHVHTRGGTKDRLQAALKLNSIDYERLVDLLVDARYEGYIAVEYIWVDWAHLNEVDVLSETVLLRDRLRAKLAGETWRYPDPRGVQEAPID